MRGMRAPKHPQALAHDPALCHRETAVFGRESRHLVQGVLEPAGPSNAAQGGEMADERPVLAPGLVGRGQDADNVRTLARSSERGGSVLWRHAAEHQERGEEVGGESA